MTKVLLFLLCLAPFGDLVRRGFTARLGANPVQFVLHRCGDWALNFLLITLMVTPLARLLKRPGLMKYRRMLGLFAYFYATLHFLTYFGIDKFFDFPEIWKDVTKRPYITVGFATWLILGPLAITSTDAMIRRLGRDWSKLHRLVYVAALGGVLHYLWLVKADRRWPLAYGAALLALLAYRAARATRGIIKPG